VERYRPPRRTGSSAGHPHGGPWSRVFVTDAAQTELPCFSHGKSIRGGLTPGLPDEAGSLPGFPGSPWPDLPRAVRDRTPPARPILSLPSRPERYLIRLPEGQAWSIAQEVVRRIPPFRRYLRRQVSISVIYLWHRRKRPEMGPCRRRGLRGESANLYPRKVRIPGGGRGLLRFVCGASRTGPRHSPG
jgi:hypothetical protein